VTISLPLAFASRPSLLQSQRRILPAPLYASLFSFKMYGKSTFMTPKPAGFVYAAEFYDFAPTSCICLKHFISEDQRKRTYAHGTRGGSRERASAATRPPPSPRRREGTRSVPRAHRRRRPPRRPSRAQSTRTSSR
jgi:hypothetical protein